MGIFMVAGADYPMRAYNCPAASNIALVQIRRSRGQPKTASCEAAPNNTALSGHASK
ncbi:hypothetical protein [Celeribacter marinus]|uniref:Uncharacterized protein n=1 Tax=Celeribacter marinus TaxID=1397108 RepID=A0A0N9ZM18_9RHOB|nr:hypothetical protein [Celeribacter marinus]ALI54284.1 hypothetical protein IMCC12053_334 [Celeribacter marinus]